MRTRILLSAALAALSAPALAAGQAFPSALGYGAIAQGGRGGEVCIVTTLDDEGPGSLRDCVMRAGPRIVTFEVSGTVALMTPLWLRGEEHGRITIAGQTSPGGIQITLAQDAADGRTPFACIDSGEMILRHLRIRGRWERGNPRFQRQSLDALTFERCDNIYLDHVSTAWTADEAINFHHGAQNVTIAHSLFAEGLAGHAYGPLSCSDQHRGRCGRITWFGNLIHSFERRSPLVKTAGAAHGVIDVINNVISNAGLVGIEIADDHGGTHANIVGNWFAPGPKNKCSRIEGYCVALINEFNMTAAENVWYAHDNVVDAPGGKPSVKLCTGNAGALGPSACTSRDHAAAPLSVTPLAGAATLDFVLNTAGAFPRDALDERFLQEVRSASGPRASPLNGGPYPLLAGGVPPKDTDRDGMPDAWELGRGLDPFAPDHHADKNANGYADLEDYLEERALALLRGALLPPPAPEPAPERR